MKHLNFSGILILLVILISGEVSLSQTCATCPGNTVTGVSASAFGAGNTASGNYSFVAGRNSTANQSYATVIGSNSRASGGHSYVVGSSSFANGNFSYVFGGNSITNFDFSTAIGHNLVANNGGFVLGQGRVDAVLTNNLQGSLMIGFNSQYPTMFVSRTAVGKQSGSVGIGNITDPQAKLHIRADEDEEATLMLETSSRSDVSTQRIIMTNNKDLNGHLELSKNRDGRSVLTLSNIHSEGKSRIVFESFQYLFQEGSVGIGTDDPRAMLDVAGEAAVDVLTIKGGYSLPSTPGNQTQFLRGDGVWAVPAGGGGGSSYWLPQGNNIYFNTGNVGIGLTNPTEKLHINGNIRLSSGYSLATNQVTAADANGLKLYNSSGSGMFVAANGSVGIGTTNTGTEFKLTVAGGIHAQDVKVTLTAGSDFVFEDSHRLAPLSEVEAFVKTNKHLPGIAPESEMLQQGLDVGSFQIKLLEKIEELTLYIIAQQKEIEALKAAVGKP